LLVTAADTTWYTEDDEEVEGDTDERREFRRQRHERNRARIAGGAWRIMLATS